jgi:hypothetical protein
MFYLTPYSAESKVSGAMGSLLPVPSGRTGEQVASGTPLPVRKTPHFPCYKEGVEFNIIPNAFAPPMPSLKRCTQVGAFVREVIARWPGQKRVAVIGTGGLSQWVGLPGTGRVNAEFDRWFLDCLVAGKADEVITKYKKAEELEHVAGNGGQEVRDWLAVAAAMPERLKPRVLSYEPIPGCGIGVMAWARE